MNIEDLTIKQVRELAALCGVGAAAHGTKRLPLAVGMKLFIRTITAHYTGEVIAVAEDEVQLKDAAWIASDGRFYDALKSGNFDEIEPFPDGMHPILNRATFLDVIELPTQLPRSQK